MCPEIVKVAEIILAMQTHTHNTKIQFLPSTNSQYNKRDKETTIHDTINYNNIYVYRILITAEMTWIQILVDSKEYPALFNG